MDWFTERAGEKMLATAASCPTCLISLVTITLPQWEHDPYLAAAFCQHLIRGPRHIVEPVVTELTWMAQGMFGDRFVGTRCHVEAQHVEPQVLVMVLRPLAKPPNTRVRRAA